jgi:hypothetical protein
MKPNEIAREQILTIVRNQIKENNPPETKQTYERLKGLGYSDTDSEMLIGQCVSIEVYNILKHKQPFDENRYIKNLNKLPKEPFD